MKYFSVSKCEDKELAVPSEWRDTFTRIVDELKAGNFRIDQVLSNVKPVSNQNAGRMADNIALFGDDLDKLPEEAWETSIYRWMDGYWEVLVDLFTIREGRSDLVLFARVFEKGDLYEFQLDSVHVP
jgi:hypothetical protein